VDDSPHVLLVDDVEDNREVYVQYLTLRGMRVSTAASGQEGLILAGAETPDILVLDLGMPELDGWEVARRIRANPSTRRVPIVALSAHADEKSRARALEAGVDVFLAKPCMPDDLLLELLRLTAPRE
jgi:two-component system, cell cycle response regulator DivK